MNKTCLMFLLASLAGLLSGCVTQLQSVTAPGANLASLKNIYVVHLPEDGRGIDQLIATQLNAMGRHATSGSEFAVPADTDAIVTYQDRWMWDMTMYMISLDVQVRQPKMQTTIIAAGHTLRTSLARRSPSEMVTEVLTQVFSGH